MLIAMAVHDTVENDRTWMTRKTLESLAGTVNMSKNRIVVVDNGSCSATKWLYAGMADIFDFTLIVNESNVGTAAAINQAWRHRKPGEHCVKMDNDVVIHQRNWPHLMELVFAIDPDIGICGLKRMDLAEAPWAVGDMKSTLRMLPHKPGQRWIVVEEVKGVMGTCQAFSSALLDRIGYLTQPGVYGFDDSLASIRARLAGFKRVFLPHIRIDHIDPGGDAYCEWKIREAGRQFPAFNAEVALYECGAKDVYCDGL